MNDPLDDYAGEIPALGHPQLARVLAFAALLCVALASCDFVLL